MTKNELIALIEEKRAELIQIADKKGLCSSAAISHSQELDTLLNEYNRTSKIRRKSYYRKNSLG